MRISHNGKLLISGGDDGILRVWTFPELNPIHEIEAHDKEIDDVEFSPDNTKVYIMLLHTYYFIYKWGYLMNHMVKFFTPLPPSSWSLLLNK